MGIFDRFRRRQHDRPEEGDAPGLFTARSGAVPPEFGGGPRDHAAAAEDLWTRPAPERAPVPGPTPGPTPAPVAEEPEPMWGESTWEDAGASPAPAPELPPELPADGGSTADEPLFGTYEQTPSTPAAVVDGPQAGADGEGGRTMRVHDGRLDKRPGPIRMTPSEAIALAQDGPQALRRRTHPEPGPSA